MKWHKYLDNLLTISRYGYIMGDKKASKGGLRVLQNYLEAVQKEMSYVGGNGAIEDGLWSTIRQLQ